jgi:pyrrolidone-carboxylate peptidase
MIRSTVRLQFARLAVASALVSGAVAAPAATGAEPATLPTASCTDPDVELTYEEEFLSRDEPARFVEGGGFADTLEAFQHSLCGSDDLAAARSVVREQARHLWQLAVARVQDKAEPGGTLSDGDDRPLYWTRLAMSATLRQWDPGFDVDEDDRAELIADLDRITRGQDDLRFPREDKVTRVLVTGFDPFTLDRDIRQANPSGASALALDGVTIKGPHGPIRLEAAMFPVRWRDFGDGMVEKALLPHFTSSRAPVDAFATTSQGRVGRIDLEHYNGAWRAGFPDNERVCYRGMVPLGDGIPTVTPQPQWTTSTHPFDAMLAANTGPFPVYDNRRVVEVAGDTPPEPVTTNCPAEPSPGTTREDGPSEGSQARAGAGGNYLSNEIAYRATLLRDAVGLDVPGGHIHTPVLQGLSSTDRSELTNDEFEANRAEINRQIRDLVLVVARTAGH